jgi:hypothetical protein
MPTDYGFISFKLVLRGEVPKEAERTLLSWKDQVSFAVASSGMERVS